MDRLNMNEQGREEHTQWPLHQLPPSSGPAFPCTTLPPVAAASATAPVVLVLPAPAALVLVLVTTTVTAPPPFPSACSLAPKSFPQFPVYQLCTAWLSTALVHTESQIPAGEVLSVIKYPDWQKQDQICWDEVVVPPQAAAACWRRGHCCAQDGRAELPEDRSWDIASGREERRKRSGAVGRMIVSL